MEKSFGKKITNISIVAIPIILGGAGYALTKNIAFFTLGAGVSIASGTAIKISDHLDYVDDNKKKKRKEKLQEVVKEDEGIQNELERIIEHEKEDALQEVETKEVENIIPEVKNEEINEEYLDKNQTKDKISKEILLYSQTNPNPLFKINEKEWDAFFDTTYDFFLSKDMQEEYYKFLSYLNRRVFADALVNSNNTVSLDNYISSLPMFIGEQITDDDIKYLSHEIYSRIESPTVISLADYMNKHDKQR